MNKTMRALGLMSGTSFDGIDAAILVLDEDRIVEFGPALAVAHDPETRAVIRSVLGGVGDLSLAADLITRKHAAAVKALLSAEQLTPADIDVIGFHGQTVLHRPAEGISLQLGDGALLAELTGIDVVNDFRSQDVAAGGEGAPLAPLYHLALAQALPKPLAVVNIGGVANVTWIGADQTLLAFDTGPGNALIDDWLQNGCGLAFDDGGACAAKGEIDNAALAAMLENPYFAAPPPKSLDRDAFAGAAVDHLDLADGAATLTAFTVQAIAQAQAHFPLPVRQWLICGGGRHNRTLMAGLAALMTAPVAPVEQVGWRGDVLEAELFAYLAVRSLRGQPLTLPSTTGVPTPLSGGRLHPAPHQSVRPR